MRTPLEVISTHPAGECQKVLYGSGKSWPLDTPGGRFYAEWDTEAPVTREGQLIFFFQFLHAGGRWKDFLRRFPLSFCDFVTIAFSKHQLCNAYAV